MTEPTTRTPPNPPMTTDSMITDLDGQAVDVATTALHRLVVALDLRFPAHNSAAERLGRLLEEIGELAEALADPQQGTAAHRAAVAKELQDVLRAIVGIAHHYGVRGAMPNTVPTPVEEPFTLLAGLVGAAGAVAAAVHHLIGMGLKREKHGEPALQNLEVAVARVIDAVLRNATHHGHLDTLHASLQASYRAYQRQLPPPNRSDR